MIVDIFRFENYRDFVRKRIEAMPKKGRGEMLRIATELRMHTSRVSHIFAGKMNFTQEQACALAKFLGLSSLESEYLLLLVNIERAGSDDLRELFRGQAKKIRKQAREVESRVPPEKVFTDEQKAIFYSSWHYSAIRLCTSIEGKNSVEAIAEHLGLPREKVRAALDFLLQTGICVEKKGQVGMGPKTTHLERGSMLAARQHANWRLKAIERHEQLGDRELAYTAPVSINEKDFAEFRLLLTQLIEQFIKKAVASEPPTALACLNIDWIRVGK